MRVIHHKHTSNNKTHRSETSSAKAGRNEKRQTAATERQTTTVRTLRSIMKLALHRLSLTCAKIKEEFLDLCSRASGFWRCSSTSSLKLSFKKESLAKKASMVFKAKVNSALKTDYNKVNSVSKIDYDIVKRKMLRKAGAFSAAMLAVIAMAIVMPAARNDKTEAQQGQEVASQTTLTITNANTTAAVDLLVKSGNGTFAASGTDVNFKVKTTNATGYNLSLAPKTAGDTDLISSTKNETDDTYATFTTIGGNISKNTFAADSETAGTAYNGRWGVKPSVYYNSTTSTTMDNSMTNGDELYMPGTAMTMTNTACANGNGDCASEDSYSIGIGARAAYAQAAGTYTNTYVLSATGNATTYTIVYGDNTGDSAVTNMPYTSAETGGATGGKQTGSQTATGLTLSSVVPKRTGYTFYKWCLGTVTHNSDSNSATGLDTCSGTEFAAGAAFGLDQTVDNSNVQLYAMWQGNQYTMRVYYNSNATSGSTSVTSATASCYVANNNNNCSATIPTGATGSVGTYNNAYAGLASSTGTMNSAVNASATTVTVDGTNSGDTETYYAIYRTNVTLNESTAVSANAKTIYRNQWFTNASTMAATVLSDASAGTTNYATTEGPNKSTWYGLSTDANTTAEYTSVAGAAASTETTFWAIYQYTVNFSKDGATGVSAIGATSGACYMITNSTSCDVTTPSITTESGYTSLGWGSQGHTTAGTEAGKTVTISTNNSVPTYYANAKVSAVSLYDTIAAKTKGTQTAAELQATITKDNSGVFTYNSSVFGASSDASNNYTIYYYRGILDSNLDGTSSTYGSNGDGVTWPNYVKLANNTCWRILRTTGSGGVKMIYNGIYGTTTAGSCANSQANAQVTTSAFGGSATAQYRSIVGVGYTRNNTYATTSATSATAYSTLFGSNTSFSGNSTNSTMKTYIEDTWYKNNMGDAYTSLLEPSAGYCNDRTLNTGTSWTSPVSDSTTIVPYGTSSMTVYYFGAYIRNMSTTKSPSLTCPRSTADLYTTSAASNGNKQLAYPVALITADEASFAGSGSSTATNGSAYHYNSFLRSGSNFWLLSPNRRASSGSAGGFVLNSNGFLNHVLVNNGYGVRPAISLLPGTMIRGGKGTATEPWVVQ